MTPKPLKQSTIAILGLGLMGGSLAIALKDHCKTILGIDPDPKAIEFALQKSIIDQGAAAPQNLLPQADILILAAPIRQIIEIIHQLPNLHSGSPIVLDLGSTKTEIIQAMQTLPSRFAPIGGHPMCGKEKLGIENADPAIFTNAPFALVPLERTSQNAHHIAEQIVTLIGAKPLMLDAQTHDRWAAATSHVPYLLSAALAASTPIEAKPLIGSGFRSVTRLAATPTSIMLDILTSNRQNILDQIAHFRKQLNTFEDQLKNATPETLKQTLDKAAYLQQQLV